MSFSNQSIKHLLKLYYNVEGKLNSCGVCKIRCTNAKDKRHNCQKNIETRTKLKTLEFDRMGIDKLREIWKITFFDELE